MSDSPIWVCAWCKAPLSQPLCLRCGAPNSPLGGELGEMQATMIAPTKVAFVPQPQPAFVGGPVGSGSLVNLPVVTKVLAVAAAVALIVGGGFLVVKSVEPASTSKPAAATPAQRVDVSQLEAPKSEAPQPPPPPPPKPKCAGGVTLPDGVDERACGPIPANAKRPKSSGDGGYGSFYLPSKNIGCDTEPNGTLFCFVMEHSWQRPPGLRCEATLPEECGSLRPDYWGPMILNGEVVNFKPTQGPMWGYLIYQGAAGYQVNYGDVIVVRDNACLIQDTGLTCWSSRTGHGFFVSRTVAKHW